MIGLACLTNVTTMFRSPSPPVRVTISNPAIVKYRPAPRYPSFEPGGKARIKFDLDADLRGIFDWSVRQAFIWITAEYPGTGKSVKNEVVIWDAIVEYVDMNGLSTTFGCIALGTSLLSRQASYISCT